MGRRTGLSLAALVLSIPAGIQAYNLDGNRWPNGESTFYVNIPGVAPSGVSWNSAFEDALAQWSDLTDFSFFLNPSYADPCAGYSGMETTDGFPHGDGDGLNGVGFVADVCGNEFGAGVLAVTLTNASPGNLGFALIDQTDILFNSKFDWDIYSGPRRSEIDFNRVALHELGHAIGLEHENSITALMSSSISELDTLQADDIAGANAIYGGPGDCDILPISPNSVVQSALQEGDCSVLELYGGGLDTSFVDTYRLILEQETTLSIMMESTTLDAVLLVTDAALSGIEYDDDSAGTCDALINTTLPAGEYLILANTYVEPTNCSGNTGHYTLSISDNVLPILTKASSTSGVASKSIFHGGATADGGITYKANFLSSDPIDVSASIQPDPEHIGKPASFYMVALLSSGQKFAKYPDGKFKQISKLSSIPAATQTSSLQPLENVALLKNLKADVLGVSNLGVSLFVGYSLNEAPGDLYFNGKPITFTIK